jgi:glycosyltransferase involved in cell wall biosynthesis
VDIKECQFTIYCSSKFYKNSPKKFKTADLVYIPIDANGVSSIFYDLVSMVHAIISGHRNLLVLGVSGAIFFPILRCFPNIKIMTNIDGIEWQRGKWTSFGRKFLKFSEALAVKFSSGVISDNSAITGYVEKEYQKNCKTIAYGGDHALKVTPNLDLDNLFDFSSPFALSICRIEPENNVHLILEAIYGSNLRMVFIGNWGKSSYGKELYIKYSEKTNITLLQPIYCLDTLHAFRSSCSVYVHGHSAGGTNPSLVEMMHFSRPIVAFDCPFNRATMEGKGDYFSSFDGLSEKLSDLNRLSDGSDLAEIAKRRYTWEIIRKQYLELFGVKEK